MTNIEDKIISPTRLMLLKFKENRLAMFGFCLFVVVILVVVIAKIYIEAVNYDLANIENILTHKFLPPSFEYPFGTDRYGRNYLIRVLTGGWISLQVGFMATLLSVTIGVLVGSIAGFFGGRIDSLLMRFTEIVSAIPFLAFAILISVAFIDSPTTLKLYIMIFILGIINWPGLARMVRGQILSLREQEFMIACSALGIRNHNQILRHLIPNVIAYVIVSATITFANSILIEATLSYLGLSVSEPVPTWGGLLQRASTSSIMKNQWWLWVFPGGLLFCLIMSVNLIGEGLRDAVDPKTEFTGRKKGLFIVRIIRKIRGSRNG